MSELRSTQPESSSDSTILLSTSPELRQQTRHLIDVLHSISNLISWNERGTLICETQEISGSNIGDIFAFCLKRSPPSTTIASPSYQDKIPTGIINFCNSFAKSSLSSSLIRNDYVNKLIMEARRRERVQVKQGSTQDRQEDVEPLPKPPSPPSLPNSSLPTINFHDHAFTFIHNL